jgi:excisionase family DNA binding protein
MNTQIFLNGITIQELAETLIPLLQTHNTANIKSDNELMTRDEVCKMLSFNKTSLWKHTRSGKLKSYAIGNRVLYKRNEVLESLTYLKK